MRIGIDYRPALLSSTGIGRAVRELCRALVALQDPRLELHLFGHSLAPARRSDALIVGAHLHRQPIPGRSLPLLARAGLDARRLCGSAPVFHLTDYVHPPLTTGGTILTLHDLAFAVDSQFHGRNAPVLLQRSRRAAAIADVVITPTAATRDHAIELLQLPGNRLMVIPFGVDHMQPSKPRAQPSTDNVDAFILMLGTIEPRKNHRRLLDAWRRLPLPRPRLVVAGRPGWNNSETLAELRRASVHGDVTWHQDPGDTHVQQLLTDARLLAYPSLLEGFGFPPLEAMALGTPVLAGDTPALREVLGDAAVFVDPRSVDAIGHGLARLLHDEGLRRTCIDRGRTVAGAFTWRTCAERHRDLYLAVGERA